MAVPWNAAKQAEYLNKMITADGAVLHPHPDAGYDRLRIQHDRDRIVWSASFKRLAQKTQVFPQAYGDHHRTRLTHSLEVMQLSTSIARALGLNSLLCEAIALGHDLGHTPFGHAGEDALDNALDKIKWNEKPKHLSRFTHYEHGVDVASYIDSRNPELSVEGMELTEWVLEGIFKHTYDHSGIDTKHKSLAFVLDHTKYKDKFREGPGSFEAQTVRICDKLSYFISDIEDGLAIGAIHVDDLMGHQLLKKHLEDVAKLASSSGWHDHRIFLQVRNAVLTKLIESLLAKSTENLKKTNNRPRIVIALGESELKETKSIYENLQKGVIFRHFFVDRATKRAKHIIACLFCQFLRHPELIPWSFRRKYLGRVDRYCKKLESIYNITHTDKRSFDISEWLGIRYETEDVSCTGAVESKFDRRITDLICVKDYVAGMTDRFAEEQFKKCVYCWASKEAWDKLERIPII